MGRLTPRLETTAEAAGEPVMVPLGGTRAQAIQRLQVGVSLLLGVILIVGLANVIEERAKQSDETAVPEAAATVAPAASAPPANDPLADAGVVPDLPAASASAGAPADVQPRPDDSR